MVPIKAISKSNYIRRSIAAMFVAAILAPPATASVMGIDGIKTASDGYNQTLTTYFHNDHHSLKFREADKRTTTISYKQFDDYLQMYIEVNLEAKNMIWGAGVTDEEAELYYQAWCSPKSGGAAPLAGGSDCDHHDKGFDEFKSKIQSTTLKSKDGATVSESYDKMTGSEKIVLLDGVGEFNLQVYDDQTDGYQTKKAPNANAEKIRTSLDYYIGNGTCNTISCYLYDVPVSFEILFKKDVGLGIVDVLSEAFTKGDASQLVFHLSPERGGPAVVPVPAAFWLFGTALVGFIGMSRRTRPS